VAEEQGLTSAKKAAQQSTAAKWAARLRGRTRMAVAAIGGVFLLGFFAVSRPLSQRIETANDRLNRAEARTILASDVHDLRRQASLYTRKLPRGVDTNEWTNYLLTIIRAERVKLIRMDPKDPKAIGPCKALAWQIDMAGDFYSLSRVIEKLESGDRLMRIDRLVMNSAGPQIAMSLVVRGLALDVPMPGGKTPKANDPGANERTIKTSPRAAAGAVANVAEVMR
jgi:hypothetical protein